MPGAGDGGRRRGAAGNAAPIRAPSRVAADDMEIRGVFIPEGDEVMSIQSSISHPRDICTDGHLFNALGPEAPHQALCAGPHFRQPAVAACRVVAQILTPVLFERFPTCRCTPPGPAPKGAAPSGRPHCFTLRQNR